jgi:DNA-binding response OmpR family regulator
MPSEPVEVEQPIRFGEGYELDLHPRRLRRGGQVLKLERIPFEILLLLLAHRDEIVTRDQIVPGFGVRAFSWTPTTVSGAPSASFVKS